MSQMQDMRSTLPMQMTKLKEIPHDRTRILLHNVKLYSQEAREERTHGYLSVLCSDTQQPSSQFELSSESMGCVNT